MALTYSEPVKLGMAAPDFRLLATNEIHHGLADFRNAQVLCIVFMCNHCPYVKAIQGRLNDLARELALRGGQLVGINSNDSTRYPDDSFEAMRKEVEEKGFVFPYLWDETQEVARAYGAVCTPDFFLFQNQTAHKEPVRFVLKYRGRMDDNWKDPSAVTRRELSEAVDALLAGREPSAEQRPSMGCSIKWRGQSGHRLPS